MIDSKPVSQDLTYRDSQKSVPITDPVFSPGAWPVCFPANPALKGGVKGGY